MNGASTWPRQTIGIERNLIAVFVDRFAKVALMLVRSLRACRQNGVTCIIGRPPARLDSVNGSRRIQPEKSATLDSDFGLGRDGHFATRTAPGKPVRLPMGLGKPVTRQTLWRRNKIATGCCPQCGKAVKRDRVLCLSCAEKQAKRDKEAYARLKRAGICPYCGKPAAPATTLCAPCGEKQVRRQKAWNLRHKRNE